MSFNKEMSFFYYFLQIVNKKVYHIILNLSKKVTAVSLRKADHATDENIQSIRTTSI